jgi:lipopolysaccharide export system protein LptA
MKSIVILSLLFAVLLSAQELKVKANSFKADEKAGISIFSGSVNIIKNKDELNASKVTIFTNKNHKPIKYIANGKVSFYIATPKGAIYSGNAEKVIYLPQTKEYHFYESVHLSQLDEKKEIIGDEVVLKTTEGKAYAKGEQSGPVIMIFDIPDEKEMKK